MKKLPYKKPYFVRMNEDYDATGIYKISLIPYPDGECYEIIAERYYEPEKKFFKCGDDFVICDYGKKIIPPPEIANAPSAEGFPEEVKNRLKELEEEVRTINKRQKEINFKYLNERELAELSPAKKEAYYAKRKENSSLSEKLVVASLNYGILSQVQTR